MNTSSLETRIMFLIVLLGALWLILSPKGKEITAKLGTFMADSVTGQLPATRAPSETETAATAASGVVMYDAPIGPGLTAVK